MSPVTQSLAGKAQPSPGFRAERAWLQPEEQDREELDIEQRRCTASTFHLSACLNRPLSEARVRAVTSSHDLYCEGHLETGYSHFPVTVSLVCDWPLSSPSPSSPSCFSSFPPPHPHPLPSPLPTLPPPLSPLSPLPCLLFLPFWRRPLRGSCEPTQEIKL